MKKLLNILLVLLLLVGCSKTETINLEDYKSFKVESNTVIEVYYDEEYKVVYYTAFDNDYNEEAKFGIVGESIGYTIDLIFNYELNKPTAQEETFVITTEDEKIDERIKDYVDSMHVKQEVNLNGEIINAPKSKLLDFDDITEYGALIYKSYDWVNKRYEFTTWFYEPYVCDVFVFADDHTGFRIKYVRVGCAPIEVAFTWDEEGNINYNNKVLCGWYVDGEVSYYFPYFGSSDGYTHERFEVQEDGTIKDIICESTNEYMLLEKVDDFSAPWNNVEYLASIGSSVETAWVSDSKMAEVYYEPSFANYSDDYNGVNIFSTFFWANFGE